MLNSRPKLITFDTYGTLIDWRTGILSYFKNLFERKNATVNLNEFYDHWYQRKLEIMAGPFFIYQEVLRQSLQKALQDYGIRLDPEDGMDFWEVMKTWEPFPDTVNVLEKLSKHYKLATITNCQNNIFPHAAEKMGNPFTYIITAEDARAYKPSQKIFELALEKAGVQAHEVLHVCQSIDVDLPRSIPMGIHTAWINRYSIQLRSGIPTPDYEFTDLTPLLGLLNVH